MSADISIDLDVVCERCGSELSYLVNGPYKNSIYEVKITPCNSCLQNAATNGVV